MMSSSIISSTLVILFSLASLLPLVSAGNLFAGCFSIVPSATTQVSGTFSSASACDAACPNNKHSFYQLSSASCYCSDKYPSWQYFQLGTADACSDPTFYDARIVTTSYLWDPVCYDSVTGPTFNSPTGPDTCLKNCGSYTNATFYVSWQTSGYYCECSSSTATYGSVVPCGPGTYFSFYHTAAQASQGLSRKRQLEAEVARNAVKQPCPPGRTACLIQGSSDAYECIDTSEELESCGGCMHGALGHPNATVGKDCTDTGAKLGASTCMDGQCVAYACKRGYDWVNKQCVPRDSERTLTVQGRRGHGRRPGR